MKTGNFRQEQSETRAIQDDFMIGELEHQLLVFAGALMMRGGKMRPREHPFLTVP